MAEISASWNKMEAYIDHERFKQITELLNIQHEEAEWWRSSCLLYFQTFSNLDFPSDIIQPKGNLEEYMELSFPYAPGIKPSW